MRKRTTMILGVGLALISIGTPIYVFYAHMGAQTRRENQIMADPKYDLKNLAGRSPAEVIEKLGKPTMDTGEEQGTDGHSSRSLVYVFPPIATDFGRTIYFNDDKVSAATWDIK
jgi:hypothetical protein